MQPRNVRIGLGRVRALQGLSVGWPFVSCSELVRSPPLGVQWCICGPQVGTGDGSRTFTQTRLQGLSVSIASRCP